MSAESTWKARLARRLKALAAAKRKVQQARDALTWLRRSRAAVKWAVAQVGTVEHPAGSNTGPKIDTWQATFHAHAVSWCGAFVGYALLHAGVKGVGIRVLYTPYILLDARAGRNGFVKTVPVEKARPGDLVLMDFGGSPDPVEHVGMARGRYNRKTGTIATVEGNTSREGSNGSDSNGGGVFKRTRPRGVIVAVARPRWVA